MKKTESCIGNGSNMPKHTKATAFEIYGPRYLILNKCYKEEMQVPCNAKKF